jgi:hypothetical protein
VGNATRTNQHHPVRRVVVLDVAGQLGAGDVADVLARSEDGSAQGLVLIGGGVKVVEDNLLKLLLNLLRLAEDDVSFALDGSLLKLGVLKDVGEDIDGLGNVGVEGFSEVDCLLALLSGISPRPRC